MPQHYRSTPSPAGREPRKGPRPPVGQGGGPGTADTPGTFFDPRYLGPPASGGGATTTQTQPTFLGRPPGGIGPFPRPEPSGDPQADALANLRAALFGGMGREDITRPFARQRLRQLVTSDIPLRQELLRPFIGDIRRNRQDGIGAVQFLLSLLGFGPGRPGI